MTVDMVVLDLFIGADDSLNYIIFLGDIYPSLRVRCSKFGR